MLTGKIKGINGDIPLSRLIMGSYTLGSYIPEDQSFKILDKYFELGGRTLDTARSYSGDLKTVIQRVNELSEGLSAIII